MWKESVSSKRGYANWEWCFLRTKCRLMNSYTDYLNEMCWDNMVLFASLHKYLMEEVFALAFCFIVEIPLARKWKISSGKEFPKICEAEQSFLFSPIEFSMAFQMFWLVNAAQINVFQMSWNITRTKNLLTKSNLNTMKNKMPRQMLTTILSLKLRLKTTHVTWL